MRSLVALPLAALAVLALAPPMRSGQDGAQAPEEPPQAVELAAVRAKLAADPAPAEKVRLLRDAGYLLQDLRRDAEAVECFQEGAELARSLKDQQLLVVHLGNLANSCFVLGDLKRGLAACTEALSTAQALDRKDHVWRLANTCGAVNLRLADFPAALAAFELALEHLPPDEPGSLGLLYSNLANAHMHVGEFARADELLDLALPLLAEHAPPLYVSAAHANRADLRVLQGDNQGALVPQTEALRIRTEEGAEPEIAQSLVGLGRIHFGLGDFEQAREALERAREIQERLNLQADLVATLGCLAEVYAELGRTDDAESAALAGLALADKIAVLGQRLETLHSLSKVYEAQGDPGRALEVLREALTIERHINTLDVRQRTAELQQSVELAQAESDLHAERERRRTAELEKKVELAEAEAALAAERERRRTAELEQKVDLAEAQAALSAERERRRTQIAWISSSGAALLFAACLAGGGLFWSKRRTLRDLDRTEGELRQVGAAAQEHSLALQSALGEIRGMEEERIRGAHLEALGVLARGIAHDFNNTLTAVQNNVLLARQSLTGRPDLELQLQESVAAIEQASRLSRQLIEFARGGVPAPELCELGSLVRQGATLAATGSGACLSFHLPADLWQAEVNRAQFLQVVINLVLNAVQAMPRGGEVKLAARNLPAAGNGAAHPSVEIAVEDSGPGIPEELREKVFKPCFSTKANGNGLGLATVKDIVRRHRGRVRVTSAGLGGARFEVVLPAAPDALPAASPAPAAPPVAAVGPARILALDDEAPVRAVYERMLARLGLEVVLAADGAAAVAEFERARAAGRPFDLLILDLTLPGGMSGEEVLAAIRAQDPGARAIVASGYFDSEVFVRPELGGFAGKLEKPFTLEMLAEALRSALAAGAAPPAAGAERAPHP